jgi:hypothetical protein
VCARAPVPVERRAVKMRLPWSAGRRAAGPLGGGCALLLVVAIDSAAFPSYTFRGVQETALAIWPLWNDTRALLHPANFDRRIADIDHPESHTRVS